MGIVKWGMVGTGDVTERKSGPALYKARNSMLYGVSNRTRAKAEDYAKRHGVGKVYEDIDEMLADPEIDIIYIATPPGSHKELAFKCAQAKKPCYIEKPVSLNASDCEEMIGAFEATGTKAFAAYYRRRLPRFVKARELIEQGAIGEVRFVHITQYRPVNEDERSGSWRVQPEISGGGIFMDVAVHQLDIINFLVGSSINEIYSVTGNQGHYYQPEDIVNICFSFESGVKGSGDWCFTAGVDRENMEIIGSKGRLALACFGTGPILLETGQGVQEIFESTPEHIQQPLIQSIVDELNGEDTCPSTLYTALKTAWVCDQVYRK